MLVAAGHAHGLTAISPVCQLSSVSSQNGRSERRIRNLGLGKSSDRSSYVLMPAPISDSFTPILQHTKEFAVFGKCHYGSHAPIHLG